MYIVMKVKKGDNVVVISGKDKGKSGTVFRAFPRTEQVVIEGVNVATYHQKGRRHSSQGQKLEKPMPIHVSNVALKDEKSGKAGRIGYDVKEANSKVEKTRVVRGGKTKSK